MNGSEKQVKWAEDIIRDAKAAMDTKYNKAQARYDNMVSQNLDADLMAIEAAFYNAVAKTYQLVKNELDNLDNAGEIINNQGIIRRRALINVLNGNAEAKATYKALIDTGKFQTKGQLIDAYI